MITAFIDMENKSKYLELAVTGHAGAGPEGHDLVCAGVSALVEALVAAVERMDQSDILRSAPEVHLLKGFASIQVSPKEEWMDAVLMVYWTIQNGIWMLAEQYPENIKMGRVLHVEQEEEGKEASA